MMHRTTLFIATLSLGSLAVGCGTDLEPNQTESVFETRGLAGPGQDESTEAFPGPCTISCPPPNEHVTCYGANYCRGDSRWIVCDGRKYFCSQYPLEDPSGEASTGS